MKPVDYRDRDGRTFRALLPDNAPASHAPRGIPVGPPHLDALRLPLAVEVRLHNELHHRGVFTARDALKRRPDVQAALMAALAVDAQRIVDLYIGSQNSLESAPEDS